MMTLAASEFTRPAHVRESRLSDASKRTSQCSLLVSREEWTAEWQPRTKLNAGRDRQKGTA
jgi:hypothetical protein